MRRQSPALPRHRRDKQRLTLLAECFLAVLPAPEFLATGLDFFFMQLGILNVLVCCAIETGRDRLLGALLDGPGRTGASDSCEKLLASGATVEGARATARGAAERSVRVKTFSMRVS